MAGKPAFTVETVGPLLYKFKLATGTFGYILAIEANEVAVFDAAMRSMTGMAGGPTTLKIALPGNMTGVKGETFVPHDTGPFMAAIT